jgi:hypothetical protein
VADLGGDTLDGRGDDAERCEVHGVAVARDDLGRDRLDGEAELFGNMASMRGSILAKVPTAPEMAQVAISSLCRKQARGCALESRRGSRRA